MTLGNFSQQAEAYQRARPTYPGPLLAELIDDAQVIPGDSVADFGAGTGIFTRMLVDRGFAVTAIEPNEAMRKQADAPEATWVNGTFDASTLESESQHWAVAAQAFHWANPNHCLREIRRILKPGRLFTVLWNNRANTESEILASTEDAIRRHVPEFDEAYRNQPWPLLLESTGEFRFVNHRVQPHTIAMPRARYLDLWRSHNRLNTMAGPERFAAFFEELSDYLQRQQIEQVDVLYRCEAWSARRV